MRAEGTHRSRPWIALAILIVLIALPIWVLVSGACLVIVKNDVGTDANVTVFLGPQPIGASRIAAGDSAWYVFTPHKQDDFAVGCRVDSLAGNRIAHARYEPGIARIYRITVGPCGHVRSYSTS